MTGVPGVLAENVTRTLASLHGKPVALQKFSPSGGGCINHGGKLQTSEGTYFLKWNDAARFPKMFVVEAEGLRMLRSVRALHVPEVIATGDDRTHQFLLLSYTESSARRKDFWELLGVGLASVHAQSAESFGLDSDNYIGSLRQRNRRSANWTAFFIEERLEMQLALGEQNGLINSQTRKRFDSLYRIIPQILLEEKPSLIHGDLWGGNVMVDGSGAPSLIDPAVYFGHREVDLAMTRLFGGFDEHFYSAYVEAHPLKPGWEERMELYNLYPLLVHVNLFGSGYLSEVDRVLSSFRC